LEGAVGKKRKSGNSEQKIDMDRLSCCQVLDNQASAIQALMGRPASVMTNQVNYHRILSQLLNLNREAREVLLRGQSQEQDSPQAPAEGRYEAPFEIPGQ
jgi:hypothetical protein